MECGAVGIGACVPMGVLRTSRRAMRGVVVGIDANSRNCKRDTDAPHATIFATQFGSTGRYEAG